MATRSGYSCPLCKRETGETNEILAETSRLICSKIPEHVFLDVDEFISMGPKVEFKQEQPKAAPQQNHTSVNVSMPVNVYNALLNRYGDKMAATIGGLASVLGEGEPMILSDTDAQRLGMILPERPKNGSHLVGLIFAMSQQLVEAKQTAETAAAETKAYEGMSPGKVVVDLGEYYRHAADRARAENMPVKVWFERAVRGALENNWF